MSTSATKVPFQPVGPGSADSHHCSVHVHPFATLGRAHGIFRDTGAVFIFSQWFPRKGGREGNKEIVRGSNCDGTTSESESRLAACGVNQKPRRILARMTI